MISIRMVHPAEIDETEFFIRSIFPDKFVHIQDEDTVMLAEYKGVKVGFVHIIDHGEKLVLQGIGVAESMRGRGIGTMLMERVLDVIEHSNKAVFLKVRATNPAVDLYSRCGFMLKDFGTRHVLVRRPFN